MGRSVIGVCIALTLVIVSILASLYVYGEVVRSSIGVTVRVGDWEIIVVNMTQAKYIRSDSSYYSAKQGFRIVLVTLKLTNIGNKTHAVGEIWGFTLVTDAKRSYDRCYTYELTPLWSPNITEDVIKNAATYNGLISFIDVYPGTSVEGDVMFQIPETESPVELHFKIGILFELTEVVVYLQPPYTFTVIRETATPTIPFALTVTTTLTTYIPITTTVRETTTIRETVTLPTTTTLTLITPSTTTLTTTSTTTLREITTIRETVTSPTTTTATTITTVLQSTTVTTTIEKPTTITLRETTTATAIDWTSTTVLAVILFVIGIAIGYIVKRR